MTVPGKRAHVAYSIGVFSATTPYNNSRDKTFVFVSEVSPTLCLKNGGACKELLLYLSLPVIVHLLQGIVAVTEGVDQVCLDSVTYYSVLKMAELK